MGVCGGVWGCVCVGVCVCVCVLQVPLDLMPYNYMYLFNPSFLLLWGAVMLQLPWRVRTL